MKIRINFIALFYIISIFYGCTAGRGGLSQPPDAAEISSAQKIRCPIAFSATHAERNRFDGIDIMITWKNISNKTIKYCYMQVYLKNTVGDRVRGAIRKKRSVVLEFTGPYKHGQINWGGYSAHPAAIYHPNAKTVHVEKVWVEFMDGSKFMPVVVDGIVSSSGFIKSKIY